MKNWHPTIQQYIENWSNILSDRAWWPKYVYHFTDVRNAANIIQSGLLYCRSEASRLNLMNVDNASPEVIQQTRQGHQRFVRLYFRPRTPTLYRNEGIRPLNQRELEGAHCPIPIYFCFDSFSILSRDDCEYSNGNMGSPRSQHSGTKEFFNSIPFNLVYHNGTIHSNEDRNEIIFRRHAEALIPGCLQLDETLKMIFCRSVAEMQTLLQLIPNNLRSRWSTKLRLADFLYNRQWTFIEEVTTVENKINFRFNPNTLTPGPFHVVFTYQEDGESNIRSWEGRRERLDRSFGIIVREASSGLATLTLDDALAYKGRVIFNDIPF
jgi:hypothetical protein